MSRNYLGGIGRHDGNSKDLELTRAERELFELWDDENDNRPVGIEKYRMARRVRGH